ncbi:MAG: hypothetical protein F4Y26_05285 [Gammaproteobacteria bacterium]|nr:hypothetical protein [Gammaproteobacteria bacterium]
MQISDAMRLCPQDLKRMIDKVEDLNTDVGAGTISAISIQDRLSDLKEDLEIAKALFDRHQITLQK